MRLPKIACLILGLLLMVQSLTLTYARAQADPAPVMVLHERQHAQHRLVAFDPDLNWRRNLTPLVNNFYIIGRTGQPRSEVLWGLATNHARNVAGGQDFGLTYRIDWSRLKIVPFLPFHVPVHSVQWSPDGRWIAYFAPQTDGTIQAFCVPAAGGETLNLSAQFGVPISVNGWEWPTFSSDSQWVYFKGQGAGQSAQLYRVRVDGTDGEGFSAKGLPVGTIILAPLAGEWMLMEAISGLRGMINPATAEQVWFTDVDAYGATATFVTWVAPNIFLTEGGNAALSAWREGATTPFWTLDDVIGFRIGTTNWLFVTMGAEQVAAITPDGQQRVDVIPPPGLTQLAIWDWTADQQWLIFAGQNEATGVYEVWRQHAGAIEKIASMPGYVTFQDVSSDGAWFFYTTIDGDSQRLYRMRPDGTAPTLIAPNGAAWEYRLVAWVTLERDWSPGLPLVFGMGLLMVGSRILAPRPDTARG